MRRHWQLSSWSCAVAVLLLLPIQRATAEVKRALLSVESLNLAPDQYLSAFRFSTWGVNILSVCRVPSSWKIEADRFEDPGGLLIGRSDVHGERLKEFRQLFLVDVNDNKPAAPENSEAASHPPSFAGSVTIASEDDRHTHRRLKMENFRLTDASSCPVPPPARP